jgi:hypothetical protein
MERLSRDMPAGCLPECACLTVGFSVQGAFTTATSATRQQNQTAERNLCQIPMAIAYQVFIAPVADANVS